MADATDALVLDAPWLLPVWPPERLVAPRDHADAPALAEVLDLPLASEETAGVPDDDGEFVEWSALPALVEVADLLDLPVPDGGVVVHPDLRVHGRAVPWWCEPLADSPGTPPGTVHAADSTEGLARAFAWAAGRWSDRAMVVALLEEPEPGVLLG